MFFSLLCFMLKAQTYCYYNRDPEIPKVVFIESYNFKNEFIRHRNYLADKTPLVSDLDRADGSFTCTLNSDGSGYYFESVNYPGYVLRHEGFRLKLSKREYSDGFNKDMTFKKVSGLAVEPGTSYWVSFESVNYPGYYLRHSNGEVWLEQSDGSQLFKEDATWRLAYQTAVSPFTIRLMCNAGYVADFKVAGETHKLSLGQTKDLTFEGGNGTIEVSATISGTGQKIFATSQPLTPGSTTCYNVSGTIFDAKMSNDCNGSSVAPPSNKATVKVFCQAGYVTKFIVNGQEVSLSAGQTHTFEVTSGSAMRIKAEMVGGGTIFNQDAIMGGGESKCYKTFGTIFNAQWNNNCD